MSFTTIRYTDFRYLIRTTHNLKFIKINNFRSKKGQGRKRELREKITDRL